MPGLGGIVGGIKSMFSAGPRGKVLLALSGIVVFAALFGSYKAYDYTANDPNFCRSCHLMEKAWDLWNTSEHSKVTCHECHSQGFVENGRLLVKYAAEHPEEVETHASIPAHVCEKCHVSGDPKWIQVGNSTGHKIHHEREKIDCATCHARTIHRFQPPAEMCKKCHKEKVVKIGEMGRFHCTTCHQYLKPREKLTPEREDCLFCHTYMGKAVGTFPEQLAPMKFDCGSCHKPHESDRPVECTRCHDVSKRGYHSTPAHTACITCHTRHAWIVEKRETCEKCHVDRRDHNPGIFCGNCHVFRTSGIKG